MHIVLWRVMPLKTPFGLVFVFNTISHVVTTIAFYAVTHLHSLQSVHSNIFTLDPVVCTYLSQESRTSLLIHTTYLHRQISCLLLFGAYGIHLKTSKTANSNCWLLTAWVAPFVFKITRRHGSQKTHLPILLRGGLFTATFLGNGRSGRVCDVTCGNVEATWYSPTPGAVWRHRGMSRSNDVNTWDISPLLVWRHCACAEMCLPSCRLEAGRIHCCITQQWVDMSHYVREFVCIMSHFRKSMSLRFELQVKWGPFCSGWS
jgi:hypothetical protein